MFVVRFCLVESVPKRKKFSSNKPSNCFNRHVIFTVQRCHWQTLLSSLSSPSSFAESPTFIAEHTVLCSIWIIRFSCLPGPTSACAITLSIFLPVQDKNDFIFITVIFLQITTKMCSLFNTVIFQIANHYRNGFIFLPRWFSTNHHG